jgi:cytosine deaminase
MLSVWSQTQALCHLDTAPNEGSWADIVTTIPARAMGLLGDSKQAKSATATSLLDVGHVADLIIFPGARRASELFARPQNDRIVIRNGSIQNTVLPDFVELDDLVCAS